jgi:filamentous hemagglutinin family protein
MKPRRFWFHQTSLFSAPLRCGAPLFAGFAFMISGLGADAGDILRGGASPTRNNARSGANATGAPTPAATDAARANARDTLTRTTKTIQSIRAMQQAARKAALKGPNNLGKNPNNPSIQMPDVPNGLGTNGLKVSSSLNTDPTKWTGAELPKQTLKKGKTEVTIKQTEQQALLHWDTFNVGKKTTLTFDQSKGGADVGKWIAFNQVTDPTTNPSQILGNIKADGQVYLINPNGVIFGGSSTVNARNLTVSSLPINTNLINQGLLNNRDAQFLFSGLFVPGGSDGTPNFDPGPPPATGYGDVTVRKGARLVSPDDGAGNGGRIMLVGENVTNQGSISTEAGQSVLAAGLQVGIAAHDGNDPSLRGLDVWVGDVGSDGGSVINGGIIESLQGSISITGKKISQNGALESNTSVSLNGRIDIKASYGAVSNPNFDATSGGGAGGPIFLNQFTGTVEIGNGSLISILPDYLSEKEVPGTELPERSQINIEGRAIHFGPKSITFAPNGLVNVRAGSWTYRDINGDRTVLDNNGNPEQFLATNYSGSTQIFLTDLGQIHVDNKARISVAGSVDVFVPVSHTLLTVRLLGAELADSPLQRDQALRGQDLVVDIGDTGVFNGKFWKGTPLGDVNGLIGLIARNAAQLTAAGGDISFGAGESIVVREGARLDVSGGYFRHEAGRSDTTYLIKDGRLVPMKNATPDQIYERVFNGESVFTSTKWSVSETFVTPLVSGKTREAYIEGASGGNLTLRAPSMALDGKLLGLTVNGPEQRSSTSPGSSIKLAFEADRTVTGPGGGPIFLAHSPTPPTVTFAAKPLRTDGPDFVLSNNGLPQPLPAERLQSVVLSPELMDENGFSSLEITNTEGDIILPENVKLSTRPGGSVRFSAANASVLGSISAPGGIVEITAYNRSPYVIAELSLFPPQSLQEQMALTMPLPGKGSFLLGGKAMISTAGLFTDDRLGRDSIPGLPLYPDGGNVSIRSYSANLVAGSLLDVSGSAAVSDSGTVSYGNAGNLSIIAATDPGLSSVDGGTLVLGSTLRGFSGAKGGALAIQAQRIKIGGIRENDALNLTPGFFSSGGFNSFSLNGVGAGSSEPPAPGQFESYKPAVELAAGVVVRPVATSLFAKRRPNGDIKLRPIVAEPGVRQSVSLSFNALGNDDGFSLDTLEIRGDLLMNQGSAIVTDPGASVSFRGQTVTLLGKVSTPGGSITVSGAGSFPLAPDQRPSVSDAQATVHIGEEAELLAKGSVIRTPDSFGRKTGRVTDGGTISISGNILAEQGARLDVSGTSGNLDLSPSQLATNPQSKGYFYGGLFCPPINTIGYRTRLESNGGLIDLTGSQMLVSDATLIGRAGGADAIGGTLSVFSGRYYPAGAVATGADINLVVTQTGNVIQEPAAVTGVGQILRDPSGASYANLGLFSLDKFSDGGFNSLSLGGKYTASGSLVPYGGNVRFDGKISLNVEGNLRLAAGGVISATDSVRIKAAGIAVGQDFLDPLHPNDIVIPFQFAPSPGSPLYQFAPTFGTGSLNLSAKLIDIGTLSLLDIGASEFDAGKGEIRGNGTLSVVGDLVLKAARIYPTTLSKFAIFAYDPAGGKGSVEILASKKPGPAPLSAGGSLSIFATTITQNGVLHAPQGSITLGWDGTDLDPEDSDLDRPVNEIVGNNAMVPVTGSLVLGNRSVTSVSAATGKGSNWIAPYGISPDGETWIDPRGVDVTLAGMPGKSVTLTGESVNMQAGSRVDIRGAGDLLASRWILGPGGSVNLLGSPSAGWGAGTEYSAGDLVSYGGATWSARLRQSAQLGNLGQTPSTNSIYWTKVPVSYAVLPANGPAYLPQNDFNTGSNASLLDGDAGYSQRGLTVGDTITLEGSKTLAAGTYVVLPARYALLPGAVLVTEKSGASANGTIRNSEGGHIVKGRFGNKISGEGGSPVWSRFEVATADVYQKRAEYQTYNANKFVLAATKEGTKLQAKPNDAGDVSFHGNSALNLAGKLLTSASGRSSQVDLSSFADILVTRNRSAASGGMVNLSSSVLNSWNVGSLVIGGLRRTDLSGQTVIDVRTDSISVNNSGSSLNANDIILASAGNLSLASGASVRAKSTKGFTADSLTVSGNGTLLRVSADSMAKTQRSGFTTASGPVLGISAGSLIQGASVLVDSTAGVSLSPNATFKTDNLSLAGGLISVVFGGADAALVSSELTPHLVLQGRTLNRALQSENLTLRSYRTIDLHGAGILGSAGMASLTLDAAGIRGFQQAGPVTIAADLVSFANPSNAGSGMPAPTTTGSLVVDASTISLSSNAFRISGYSNLALIADQSIRFTGTGSLRTVGNLRTRTPVITGASRAKYSLVSGGVLDIEKSSSASSSIAQGLGAQLTLTGASVNVDSTILLPSGSLTLHATSGDVSVGGEISVAGSSKRFNDLIRYANGGSITLQADSGDVLIEQGASVSVAANSGGGDAGTLRVSASHGRFQSRGTLQGSAASTFASGSFRLDVGTLDASGDGSFENIETSLARGGFAESISYRVRNGDITVASNIKAREFNLAADQGSILVSGTINGSGSTGGSIHLLAQGDLTIAAGSLLTVAAEHFDSAGKGGSIMLEAGAVLNGVANPAAMLDVRNGSTINLGVGDFVAGSYTQKGSSAFNGQFTGTLHLRAPRNAANNDFGLASLEGSIIGASAIIAEGFRVYTPAGGVMNIALRNQIDSDSQAYLGAAGSNSANETAMTNRILSGNPAAANLGAVFVLAPGVEIINPTGDLTLGLANNTSAGSTNNEALAAADWDLSGFRYGSKSAPGVLTMRAAGDVIFNNTLSDGFVPIAQGSAQVFADNGHSLMWLATPMSIKDTLPVNTQSWSYRLTAGADFSASDFRATLGLDELNQLLPGKGSVLVGEFYPAVPNSLTSGTSAGIGTNGQTADTIRISSSTANRGNRFEVVRTGTGNITVSAGRDVQLRNQFSTIYTAGVALPDPSTVFESGDFVLPNLPTSLSRHPSQTVSGTLGAIQQLYPAHWTMAGGNISIMAGSNIGRYTLINGVLTVDSSRQMPTNWLYRRSFVDPNTGLFADNGGFGTNPNVNNQQNINDSATSTTWWIDFSNFFQSVGTLGGGDIFLTAGNDVVNVDAAAPTNARMAGRKKNPQFGTTPGSPEYLNLAPDTRNLVELGGGDIRITSGRNIDGGVYYVERGKGTLNAGGAVTTNAARSPNLNILNGSDAYDPLTWMPTTLFVGKSSFDVTASGDILLGPVSNPFLLPQGINNKYWYKTYFSTFSPDAGVNVQSLGGSVTHRNEVNLPFGVGPSSLLGLWFGTQNAFNGTGSASNASNFQPWLRLAELSISGFGNVFDLTAPNLASTSFAGDVRIVGNLTLAPSRQGNLEFAASGGVIGLNPISPGRFNGQDVMVWSSSTVNVSDASPGAIPSITSPLSYQLLAGRSQRDHFQSSLPILSEVNRSLAETGSFTGEAGSQRSKEALHDRRLLHSGDRDPVRIYAESGDITGFTLFSPKQTRVIAGNDLSDVSFYLQNLRSDDFSLVSAGRDIIPFNETSKIRAEAENLLIGNVVGDSPSSLVGSGSTRAMAGDIRISGPGVLEVVAGRSIDLGAGANFLDGTGTGITSIGNLRNPFLPFAGADIVTLAGLTGPGGKGPANGLSSSSLNIDAFISRYLKNPDEFESDYLSKLGGDTEFKDLTDEQQAIVALERFFKLLRNVGKNATDEDSYKPGYDVIEVLFGENNTGGELLTRSREIRTTSGGAITLGVPDGGITMASEILGNPLAPPGIVTEFGGKVSTFTDQSVDLGQARIFTLRGGDIIMWSSEGNIAAGTSPRTVVTAPPTRVVIDSTSASVQTDLGGLATGGGIGVLAAVEGVEPGSVALIAPQGFVDAGDAGIQATGNITIAANTVLNAGNISAGGTTSGSAVSAPASPSVSAVTTASNTAAATTSATNQQTTNQETAPEQEKVDDTPSVYSVQVIGYGGGAAIEDEEDEEEMPAEE